MKNKLLSIFLLASLALLLLPAVFSSNVASVKAQTETSDPIDAGITDLKAKVNATYARGDCYSVRYDPERGVYVWRSEPAWVWSEEEQRYVPYIFRDKYATEGYYEVSSGLISARIYDYYARFYAPENFSDVRLYDERWEVQRLGKNGKWSDVGAQSGTPIFTVSKSETCVNITKAFHSWAGWLNITYVFREGQPLKHTVVFKSEIASTETFRVVQKWAGIVAAKVKHIKGEDVITSAKTIDSPWFRFEKADGNLSIFENQWSMYYGFNETTGEVYVKANECLQPVEIDVHAQGLKANFVFGNWTLASGESLTVDPDTRTISPPVEDSFVYSLEGNKNFDGVYNLVVGTVYLSVYGRRVYHWAYIKFSIASIPDGMIITYAEWRGYFYNKYYGTGHYSLCAVASDSWSASSITWNNKPAVGDVQSTFDVPSAGWYYVSCTSFIKSEYEADETYVSLCVKHTSTSTDYRFDVGAEEHPTSPSALYVEYSPPNTAPNAPTLNSPAANARFDPSASITFTWTFSDPDTGDSQSAFQFQLDDNSDFSSPIIDTGKVSSTSSSTTQTLPSTVGLYYWRVKTWDSYDAEGPWSSGRTIIVDRVQITLSVSDTRIDVGSTMPWSFTAVYEYDSTDATSYVTVTLNDTTTKNTVGRWAFTVSSITESQYGLTAFTSNTIECIWDRVNIVLSVSDTRIDVGSTGSYSFTATYEYDSADASSFVSVTLNDTLTKSTVGKYGYTVASITESQYGLTAFSSNSFYIIFDKVIIDTFTVADNRINVGDTSSFTVDGYYAYDSGAWSGSYTLNDTATKNTVGKYGYSISSITDDNYGLTVFEQTAPDVYVIFDKLSITLSTPDDRIDVGSTATVNYVVTRQYDGSASSASITLNDTLTKNVVGKYGYTVSSVSGDEYGITAFDANSISIIFDRVQITLSAVDDRINVGDTAEYTYTAIYEYDGADAADYVTLTLNDTLTKNTVGKYGYTASSISESQYGLTAFASNTFYIIFDKLSVVFSASNLNPLIDTKVTISWTITRMYDNSAVTNFVIDIAKDGELWMSDLTVSSVTDTSGVGSHTYDVYTHSVTDNTYGLTVFQSTPVTVTWHAQAVSGSTEYTGLPSPAPSIQLDIIVHPMRIDKVWWQPTYMLHATVINKGTIGADILFECRILDKTNNVIYRSTQTVYIGGMEEKTLNITIPELPDGIYAVQIRSIAPAKAESEAYLTIQTPFYGSPASLIMASAIIIALIILYVKGSQTTLIITFIVLSILGLTFSKTTCTIPSLEIQINLGAILMIIAFIALIISITKK